MTRAVRFMAALLLAGVVLALQPSTLFAKSTSWTFDRGFLPGTSEPVGLAISFHDGGGHIGFACARGELQSNFWAYASTGKGEEFLKGDIIITWRIYDGPERRAAWSPFKHRLGGAFLGGQDAYAFAREILNSEFRSVPEDPLVLRSSRGTTSFGFAGARLSLVQLLVFCELMELEDWVDPNLLFQ